MKPLTILILLTLFSLFCFASLRAGNRYSMMGLKWGDKEKLKRVGDCLYTTTANSLTVECIGEGCFRTGDSGVMGDICE